ncbi:hypothetical protein A3C09_03630 [Candidatus Uhrbacteria bacterium RIFCSPHIGHO2_02_FULL_47_44]|uniref:ABC transmembrane type-1 domain-containing protein n=1 Tax=Candidatus Uhrbacteria bacterium RIFCSPLOWO2_02_FULL_48_18 TaxID=1802408 RepID=A0A1F7V6Z0_9BACT|nr:MAG: hypothetical protein A3C09_03630 [Candidatus Uhrbacteria bacterium RIFCSPHIGHO2_02_FULL_47_44]OGL76109.1 MAG: hypothetical protein A3E97_02465 [Candidatus Uhrbacteria bacterium RIFCSPHIGHO2_12_FULL_47_12]OGL80391.1 MAG: hypothetical protein A3B20_03170 [Candidatus Uhrbacteria bacterium RIFCSPLOWO2_01_FULL_47_17]OGL86250.1 MAG: hypothetical protein A3I41_01660 [Candidatus Uhrbacteria bacterium RIFCSPLOWO2_02_FULL_48_18]
MNASFWNTEAPVNGWRVMHLVCCVLFGVWYFAALPMISMRFGGFGGNVSRYVFIQEYVPGFEMYRTIILTERLVDEYMRGVILSALPALILLMLEIFSWIKAKEYVRKF